MRAKWLLPLKGARFLSDYQHPHANLWHIETLILRSEYHLMSGDLFAPFLCIGKHTVLFFRSGDSLSLQKRGIILK